MCLRQFALTCFVIVMVSVPLLMSQDLAAASSGAKRLVDTLNNKRMAACKLPRYCWHLGCIFQEYQQSSCGTGDAAWEEAADAEEGTPRKIVSATWTVQKDLDCLDPPRLGLCRRN